MFELVFIVNAKDSKLTPYLAIFYTCCIEVIVYFSTFLFLGNTLDNFVGSKFTSLEDLLVHIYR